MSGFTAEGKPDKKCTVDDIVADLKLPQSKLDVKMQYLLGFNEPWDTNPALYDKKYIKP